MIVRPREDVGCVPAQPHGLEHGVEGRRKTVAGRPVPGVRIDACEEILRFRDGASVGPDRYEFLQQRAVFVERKAAEAVAGHGNGADVAGLYRGILEQSPQAGANSLPPVFGTLLVTGGRGVERSVGNDLFRNAGPVRTEYRRLDATGPEVECRNGVAHSVSPPCRQCRGGRRAGRRTGARGRRRPAC